VPTLIRLAVDHVVSDITIFPAYFPFVVAAAAFPGWRSAVVATILSALVANFMFMGDGFTFSVSVPDIVSTLLFLLSAVAVIVGVERLKSAAHAAALHQGTSRLDGALSRPLARGIGILLAASLAHP
jgi:K+-sensing histidine kinase KdpD